jgi:hypothetical protein
MKIPENGSISLAWPPIEVLHKSADPRELADGVLWVEHNEIFT